MAFLEAPYFPDEIAAWAQGGGGFRTTVVETYGGFEYRNAAWSQTRGEWSIVEALRSTNVNGSYAVNALRNFQKYMFGMWGGFRFRNYAEQDFEDQGSGTFTQIGSGSTYQMYKDYPIGASGPFRKKIQKPRLVTSIAGGGSYTTDLATGIVTVNSGGAPTAWVGTFDVPARFNVDLPRLGLITNGAMFDWPDIRIIEIRV